MRSLKGQAGVVLIAWIFLISLHWQNDGLWFQGDAPRHAANGIFWKDFLLSGSLNPQQYALAYYARYPVITPAAYPPAFYILEGIAFGIFHPSPYLAKFLVQLYVLAAAFYLLAWMRRWIGAEAGWSAALLLLLPGVVRYSHAIMLNIPATALSIAALYHARRWLEGPPGSPAHRQLYLTAIFSSLAILTYFPAGIVVPVLLTWLLFFRRWDLLWSARPIAVGLICAAALWPWIWIALRWVPIHSSFVIAGHSKMWTASNWIAYAEMLPELVNPYLLFISALGIAAGMTSRRWRRESGILALVLVTAYVALSALTAKEARYGLLFCFPVVCFCGLVQYALSGWLTQGSRRWARLSHAVPVAAGLSLVGAQAILAAQTPVKRIEGIKEVVSYVEQAAPAEPVFYDGRYDGIFTFYLQSGDPDFQRGVVLGAKLLYASALNPMSRYRSFVDSADDVVRTLQQRGGCRILAIESGAQSEEIPAARLLREAVRGPHFELLRSFPIAGGGLERIDVYRFRLDPMPVDDVDLPFPGLGDNARFRVRPIQR